MQQVSCRTTHVQGKHICVGHSHKLYTYVHLTHVSRLYSREYFHVWVNVPQNVNMHTHPMYKNHMQPIHNYSTHTHTHAHSP